MTGKAATTSQGESRAGESCVFSILIGLVSTEDKNRILEALDALRSQQASPGYEIVLADRRQDSVSEIIRARYPEARIIACPAGTSLPELRTIALDHARGEYIVVTEDHCVPSGDWLFRILEAFRTAPPGVIAVGGCIENGVRDTALDWATFLCEYSAFITPVHQGVGRSLPGMNVAYRRTIFADFDRTVLTSGFWETTLHPSLIARGLLFYSDNKVRLFHSKKFSFSVFAKQRFLYSRYYAGLRFNKKALPHRVAACALTVLLPPLLLFRMAKSVLAKRRLHAELLSALPALTVFVLIWAYGEMVGYALGPGDALSRIE